MDIDELVKTLEKIQTTVNKIESDLIADRTAFDKFQHSLDAIISRQNTLEGRIPRLEDKMADAVSKASSDVLQPLTDAIDKAVNNQIMIKKSFWQKFFK